VKQKSETEKLRVLPQRHRGHRGPTVPHPLEKGYIATGSQNLTGSSNLFSKREGGCVRIYNALIHCELSKPFH
jgi:hypothetical protein